MKYSFSIIIIVLLLCYSCDSSRHYEDYHDFKSAFWHKDSVQKFEFKIDETGISYNTITQFRVTPNYPFYNLYYQFCLTNESGDTIINELKEAILFDPKTGKPLGDGLGDLLDNSSISLEKFTFNKNLKYIANVKQMMRMDSLPYVLSVGCRVEKNQ